MYEKAGDVAWSVLAAIDYRENNNDPNRSALSGEPIGSTNPDNGAVTSSKLDSLQRAVEHVKGDGQLGLRGDADGGERRRRREEGVPNLQPRRLLSPASSARPHATFVFWLRRWATLVVEVVPGRPLEVAIEEWITQTRPLRRALREAGEVDIGTSSRLNGPSL